MQCFQTLLLCPVQVLQQSVQRLRAATGAAHAFELCLMVDNSGTMTSKADDTLVALVVLMEVLRKLEVRAAWGGAGDGWDALHPRWRGQADCMCTSFLNFNAIIAQGVETLFISKCLNLIFRKRNSEP